MREIHNKLMENAKIASNYAYAPYSKFKVGAAVLTSNDKIYIGANIENSSTNLGICAERIAIANAIMNDEKEIKGIAIYCKDAKLDVRGNVLVNQTLPCGACLQWLSELASSAWIITNGSKHIYSIDDLLPKPFKLF